MEKKSPHPEHAWNELVAINALETEINKFCQKGLSQNRYKCSSTLAILKGELYKIKMEILVANQLSDPSGSSPTSAH